MATRYSGSNQDGSAGRVILTHEPEPYRTPLSQSTCGWIPVTPPTPDAFRRCTAQAGIDCDALNHLSVIDADAITLPVSLLPASIISIQPLHRPLLPPTLRSMHEPSYNLTPSTAYFFRILTYNSLDPAFAACTLAFVRVFFISQYPSASSMTPCLSPSRCQDTKSYPQQRLYTKLRQDTTTMRRSTSISTLVFDTIFPPRASSAPEWYPSSWSTFVSQSLVPEMRTEIQMFYGDTTSLEAKYPGLDYANLYHRRRLIRHYHHRLLFNALDKLELTENEIRILCIWEGTLYAKLQYEIQHKTKVVDTTGRNCVEPGEEDEYMEVQGVEGEGDVLVTESEDEELDAEINGELVPQDANNDMFHVMPGEDGPDEGNHIHAPGLFLLVLEMPVEDMVGMNVDHVDFHTEDVSEEGEVVQGQLRIYVTMGEPHN